MYDARSVSRKLMPDEETTMQRPSMPFLMSLM